MSNKLSHTSDPNIMRLRSKTYLTIAQFLNKDGKYKLSEAYAFKCIDLCSVELSTRFNGRLNQKVIDLNEVSRLRKCASIFMLACYNIAYSNIYIGDIAKSFESYSLAEYVIKKCYRKQDQMFKTADKTRRFANVVLLPHIWKV